MKRICLSVCPGILIISLLFPLVGQAQPEISGYSGVLIDQDSGRVLFEKRAHEKKPIASITKVMTAIIAIESGQMEEKASVSKRAIHVEGSSIYLKEGEKMTIEDLVYGLMLRSGNDAAVAISEHIGGSVEGFEYLMNEKARWLGMTNTHFTNPHGLNEEEHYSTAYDMGVLMRYAMQNDIFRKITGTTSYKAENRIYAWQNKNKLLTTNYDYCIGGKTGYTRKSGRTLVSAAKKGKMELIAVTLNAGDDWRDHIALFNWGFDKYTLKKIGTKGKRMYETKEMTEPITGMTKDNFYLPMTNDEKVKKRTLIDKQAIEGKKSIIGKTTYYIEDKKEKVVPIYTPPSVQRKDTHFLHLLQKSIEHMIGIGFKW